MDPPHRRHRRAVSTPKNLPSHMNQPIPIIPTPSTRHVSSPPTSLEPSRPPRTASRIMNSVKRSLTPSSSKTRSQGRSPRSGMYSTPEERMPPQQLRQAHFLTSDEMIVGSAPPTIEQIAMGLHISRTPHLRPLGSPRHPYSRGPTSAAPVALPPPPARSSMKKPPQSGSSPAKNSDSVSSGSNSQPKRFGASSSTVTSTTTPPSSARSSGAFFTKFRMGRFLSGSRSSSAPSSSLLSTPVTSPRNSNSDLEIVQKKAVRFQAEDRHHHHDG